MITIDQSVFDEMVSDALRVAPAIACGVLAGEHGRVSEYFACRNVASNAEREFETDPEEMLEIQRECENSFGDILGISYSDSHTPAYPSPETIRNWLPSYVCFIVSIRNPSAPELKAFRIHGERVTDEPIQIVDEDYQEEGNEREDEEDDSRGWEKDYGVPIDEEQEEGLIQKVRHNFSNNRYLGWHFWLRALDDARSRSDWNVCFELAAELERGYELDSEERRRHTEILDWILLQRAGMDAIWTHYNRRLQEGLSGPDTHFRLALVFERQGSHDAARDHLKKSLTFNTDPDTRTLLESALHALDEEQKTGVEHGFFTALWRPVMKGPLEPTRDLAQFVRSVLEGSDWQRGREAIYALESLNDVDNLGKALDSTSPAVRVAAAGALRRIGHPHADSIFGKVMDAESALLRWQAACYFAENGSASVPVLLRAVQQDSDISVRLAAVKGLARNGRRDALPVLRKVPPWEDVLGTSLQQAAADAVRQIERRYPPPSPPKPPPQPVRSAEERAKFLMSYQIQTAVLLSLGILPILILNPWASVGYLLYAWVMRRILEPYLSSANFFTDKPCYTGRRDSHRLPGSRLREALNVSLLNLPLRFMPWLALVALWLRGWSWGILALTLLGGLAWLYVVMARNTTTATGACKYCLARERCPRWAFTLRVLSGQAAKSWEKTS